MAALAQTVTVSVGFTLDIWIYQEYLLSLVVFSSYCKNTDFNLYANKVKQCQQLFIFQTSEN